MGVFDSISQRELAAKQQSEQARKESEREIEKQKLYAEMARQQAQNRMAIYNSGLQNAGVAHQGSVSGMLGGNSIYANQAAMQASQPAMTAAQLDNDPMMGVPLSVLCDLWRAAFGEGWIRVDKLDGTWVNGAQRLVRTQRAEMHLNFYRIIT